MKTIFNKNAPFISSIDYIGPYRITTTSNPSSNYTIGLSNSTIQKESVHQGSVKKENSSKNIV